MTRLRRSGMETTIWHAMSRGVRQSPLFFTKGDRQCFLNLLERHQRDNQVSILAYALMDNHFHLLIEACGEAIGRYFQSVTSRYALRVNRSLDVNGHLFQGRFRAYPAQSPAWVVHKSIYIHLNPVSAGLLKDPTSYEWSSAAVYSGLPGSPPLTIRPERVLDLLNTNRTEAMSEYRRMLLDGASLHFGNGGSVAMYVDPESNQPENLKVNPSCVQEVRILIQTLGRIRLRKDLPLPPDLSQALVCLLSYEWDIAPRAVVSAVLGLSVKSALRKRAMAAQFLKERPDILRVIGGVKANRKHFTLLA